MKEGWQLSRLGDICDFQNGFAFKSDLFREDGYPILRISNIQEEEVETRRVVFFNPDDYPVNLDKYRIVKDDLLIAMSGATTGKIGFNTTDKVFYLNQRVGRFCPSKYLLKRYLFYFLLTRVEENLRISAGSAQPNLSTEQIKNFEIPTPTLPEQQRIVAILDEAFESIAIAKANAQKNLQNARALFESYLQGVFSQGGEGWEEKRLVEISLKFGRGKSKHRPRNDLKLYGGQYPLIQTGDISNADHWLTSYTQTYSDIGLAQSQLWPRGTVCIAIVGANVGETAILDFDSCFPDSVIGIIVNDQVANNEYVDYLLQSFKAILKEKGKGTARDNINLGTFEGQKFPFPSLQKQIVIVATLNLLREEIGCLESLYQQKITALDELKKALLHQAFSGQL